MAKRKSSIKDTNILYELDQTLIDIVDRVWVQVEEDLHYTSSIELVRTVDRATLPLNIELFLVPYVTSLHIK